MPDQPDIQQRIAEILDKHTPSGAEGCVTCWCSPTQLKSFWQHSAHVAQVLVSELGIRRDETTYVTMSTGIHHRYVTEWVPDVP